MHYRIKYKKHFGIEFDENFEVHHIDLDRKNNDIDNLVLLPKELHEQYHSIINSISVCPEKPKADGIIDLRLNNALVTEYGAKSFELLPEVMAKCQRWYRLKLDGYPVRGRKSGK